MQNVIFNKDGGNVTLKHEAIPAIGWGAITMKFKDKDKMMLDKVKYKSGMGLYLISADQKIPNI